VAFTLGWQMAEVYRPDTHRSAKPASEHDLPGVSTLSADELQEMGLYQVQAGITKLAVSIKQAGLELPDAETFADNLKQTTDRSQRDKAVRDFHVALLSTLTAADFRQGKAYGLGRALADTTRFPPDLHNELKPYRVANLAAWTRDLATALPPHAAHPVADSLEAWSRWAAANPGSVGKTHGKLGAQGRLWRSLLSGERRAVDLLETGDYIKAGEGLLQQTAALTKRFLAHYKLLLAGIVALFVIGVVVIAASNTGGGDVAGAAAILASLGVTWKGIGASMGTAASRAEQPLWHAEIDTVIYERITPDEIVKHHSQMRGPDDPSLVVTAPHGHTGGETETETKTKTDTWELHEPSS
jgi:hypothetical protein